jgi:hypothetical protein
LLKSNILLKAIVLKQIIVQTDFKGRISGFSVADEEFRGFFSSVVHEILQFCLVPQGALREERRFVPIGRLCEEGLC